MKGKDWCNQSLQVHRREAANRNATDVRAAPKCRNWVFDAAVRLHLLHHPGEARVDVLSDSTFLSDIAMSDISMSIIEDRHQCLSPWVASVSLSLSVDGDRCLSGGNVPLIRSLNSLNCVSPFPSLSPSLWRFLFFSFHAGRFGCGWRWRQEGCPKGGPR